MKFGLFLKSYIALITSEMGSSNYWKAFPNKKNYMKNWILTTSLLWVLLACKGPQANDEKWMPLFNGKNLDGWDIKFTNYPMGVNYKNTFRVEDGLLKVRYDDYDSLGNIFGHLITQQTYSHYKVRAEYRFVGEQMAGGADWAYRNNGIMIHCQSAESMRKDQDFPVSIEVQLLGGDGTGPRSNMNVCTPGTLVQIDGAYFDQHCYSSTAGTYDGDQWVTVEVEVRGDSIVKHIIDGETVLQYERPILDEKDRDYERLYSKKYGKRLVMGHIALQAESHPTDFRKVEILVLDEN
jgi:hypothetical protein